MIVTESRQNDTLITLSPNRSSSMRQTRYIVIGVSVFVLLIGIGWSFVGGFLVLPFAGIDVALFAYFMHKVCDSSYEKQVITINNEQIVIQSGKHCVEHTTQLDRPSAYVTVTKPEIPSEPIILNLADAESRFELGPFLSNSDKVAARHALQRAGLREVNEQWWKPLD